ncbi:enoyl-CoA hydratase/isomerase family protein [Sphingobium phenoxybenzoativorans]|uniref:enoyl-CoA hydratase/isomerase family protein n=1 Tax=Sphingobium phenoxybenzoativorans TaxID=1592790 RepID=UPI000872A5D5|nr:enoyl-CoA hydratase-related protein [Sphingobium phenoxybenzoativorans]
MSGLIVERHGPVLLLIIDREERRNAIDAETSAAIDSHIGLAESNDSIGAIIITGSGERAFCAGMDMKEAAEIGVGHGLIPGRGFAGITERRRTKPLIAAVNGMAVAGGFEIALACDIVIAADHAMFGLSEVKRGLFAFAGGVQRLARQVPRSTALSLILTGEPLSATRMYGLGVISEIVPSAQLRQRALDVAHAMLQNSWEAIRNGKLLYEMAADIPIDQSLRFGRAFGEATLKSADSQEGVAAFSEGRDATFGRFQS